MQVHIVTLHFILLVYIISCNICIISIFLEHVYFVQCLTSLQQTVYNMYNWTLHAALYVCHLVCLYGLGLWQLLNLGNKVLILTANGHDEQLGEDESPHHMNVV